MDLLPNKNYNNLNYDTPNIPNNDIDNNSNDNNNLPADVTNDIYKYTDTEYSFDNLNDYSFENLKNFTFKNMKEFTLDNLEYFNNFINKIIYTNDINIRKKIIYYFLIKYEIKHIKERNQNLNDTKLKYMLNNLMLNKYNLNIKLKDPHLQEKLSHYALLKNPLNIIKEDLKSYYKLVTLSNKKYKLNRYNSLIDDENYLYVSNDDNLNKCILNFDNDCYKLLSNENFKCLPIQDKYNLLVSSGKYTPIIDDNYNLKLELNNNYNKNNNNEINDNNEFIVNEIDKINNDLKKISYLEGNKFYYYKDNNNNLTLNISNNVQKKCLNLETGIEENCNNTTEQIYTDTDTEYNINENNNTNEYNDQVNNIYTNKELDDLLRTHEIKLGEKTENLFNEYKNQLTYLQNEIYQLKKIIFNLNIIKLYNKDVLYNNNDQMNILKKINFNDNKFNNLNNSFKCLQNNSVTELLKKIKFNY